MVKQTFLGRASDGQEPDTASGLRVGDLVKVNKTCDAGGMWGMTGLVVGFPPPLFNGLLVHVLINGRRCVLRQSAVDIL
jgi:hypothetical protein